MRRTTFETSQKNSLNEVTDNHVYGFKMVENFDDDRYGSLKKEFIIADISKDGQLSRNELENYMQQKMTNDLKREYKKDYLDRIFNKMDENHDQIVTLDEFTHYYYRQEDDYKLTMKDLLNENNEYQKQIDEIERGLIILRKRGMKNQAGFIHITLLQGNFAGLNISKDDLKTYKLRISFIYKEKEFSSKSIYNTLFYSWNELFVIDLVEVSNLNFDIILEQLHLSQSKDKLEKIKNLASQSLYYKNIDNLPFESVNIALNDMIERKKIGNVELFFEYFATEELHKNKIIATLKEKIARNSDKVEELKKDYEYLKILFGYPLLKKQTVVKQEIKVQPGFFQNFDILFHNPNEIKIIDPKSKDSAEKVQKEIFESRSDKLSSNLFKYFPLLIFAFNLIVSFNRSDFLTFVLLGLLYPYLKNGWSRNQFAYTKLMFVFVILNDILWLILLSPELIDETKVRSKGQKTLDEIVWIFSLINCLFKILYLFVLIILFNKNKFNENLVEEIKPQK